MLCLLGLVTPASTSTPPILRLTTSSGHIATIDSTATVVFSGACTGATCTTSFVGASSGQIFWSGSVGTFSIRLTVGLTKPILFPSPSEDLNIQAVSTTADGTITFEWTDTNFQTPGITSGTLQVGGVLTGNGNSTYKAYFDDTNAPFALSIPVGTVGPLGTGSFSGTASGPGPTTMPFLMTEVVTINLTAGSTLGVDFHFIAQPSPLQLTCASATGQVGVPYSSPLIATGGVPPYSPLTPISRSPIPIRAVYPLQTRATVTVQSGLFGN